MFCETDHLSSIVLWHTVKYTDLQTMVLVTNSIIFCWAQKLLGFQVWERFRTLGFTKLSIKIRSVSPNNQTKICAGFYLQGGVKKRSYSDIFSQKQQFFILAFQLELLTRLYIFSASSLSSIHFHNGLGSHSSGLIHSPSITTSRIDKHNLTSGME